LTPNHSTSGPNNAAGESGNSSYKCALASHQNLFLQCKEMSIYNW